MLPVLIGVTALAAGSDWWAVATGHRKVEFVAKPATLAALTASAIAAGAFGSAPGILLVAGLVLGLVGDVALLGRSPRAFIAGLAAFLLGHLAYAAAFALLQHPRWPTTVVGVVAVGALLVAMRPVLTAIRRAHGSTIGTACAVYAVVIAGMAILAWLTGDLLIAVGATVFMLSDALIARGVARHGFDAAEPRERLAVMVTYHVGQAALVAGVLLAVG